MCTTACHFNYEDVNNNPLNEDYEITLTIIRVNNHIQSPEVIYKVSIVHNDINYDFAIIELQDNSHFKSSDVIRICEQKDISLTVNDPEF